MTRDSLIWLPTILASIVAGVWMLQVWRNIRRWNRLLDALYGLALHANGMRNSPQAMLLLWILLQENHQVMCRMNEAKSKSSR